jgi:ribonuclease P protein component
LAVPLTPENPGASTLDLTYPKSRRILKSAEFRQVYDQGKRWSCAFFAAFFLKGEETTRFGFTCPRALGKANVRNRIRRRLRETVRRQQAAFPGAFLVVFNPRRAVLEAATEELEREVRRLAARMQ